MAWTRTVGMKGYSLSFCSTVQTISHSCNVFGDKEWIFSAVAAALWKWLTYAHIFFK